MYWMLCTFGIRPLTLQAFGSVQKLRKCLGPWSWHSSFADSVHLIEVQFNYHWPVIARETPMGYSMSTKRRCPLQVFWWRSCFSLQRTLVLSCPHMRSVTSTSGLMTSPIRLFTALMVLCNSMWLHDWMTSRSSHGSCTISMHKVIFHLRLRRSLPLLSPLWSGVGNVSVRLGWSVAPTHLSLIFISLELYTPHCLSHRWSSVGRLGGFVPTASPVGAAGIWSIWRDPVFGIRFFWILTLTCQQARVAQTGTPIADKKMLDAAVGVRCLISLSVGLFSWLADIKTCFLCWFMLAEGRSAGPDRSTLWQGGNSQCMRLNRVASLTLAVFVHVRFSWHEFRQFIV